MIYKIPIGGSIVARIIVDIQDEQKAERLFALLCDLDYVDAQVEGTEIIWGGHLPVFDDPVYIPGFTMFAREELYDR
ncbi:MAG: hypothetical protein FWG48_06640 [Oscillospiraceae bacterium]|nr:hypothetical protein [Oscillospiraceae bacterium]